MTQSRRQRIIDDFHKLYYDSHAFGKTWRQTSFLGVQIQKNPLDLFVYQEILYDVRPDIIIETGTAYGGGALYLASLCDLLGHGKVVTIDVTNTQKGLKHKRITYLIGSSTNTNVVKKVKKLIYKKKKVLVILDSDHSKKHVLDELNVYSKFVSKGSYIIVEDSNVNGYPVYKEHGAGPMEAIEKFLLTNKDFTPDRGREKFYFTYNPKGFLKKLK